MLLLQFIVGHYGFVLLLGLTSYIVGLRLTRHVAYDSAWEEVGVCLTLGLGVQSYLIFLLGMFALLYPSVILLAAGCCLAACYAVLPGLGRRIRLGLKGVRPLRLRLIVVGLGFFAMSIPVLILPLYPPTAFDATMYFLATAKVFAQSHQIGVTPYLRFPVLPQLNEMLFTLALVSYDDIAAQLIQFLLLVTLAIVVFAFCRRYFSKRAGWWAVAVLLANPLVLWVGSVAYLDIGLMLFSATAAYTFFNWLSSRKTHWLTLTGIFCGFAAGTKYPGIFFACFFLSVTLYIAIRERKYLAPLQLGATALAAAGPWYIRNYYHTGNPVFPFFPQLFGYSWWSAEDLQGVLVDLKIHGVGTSLSSLISIPWHLAFNQSIFVMEAPLSFLYFFALPLLILFFIKDARIRKILIVASAFSLFWFFSSQVLRYILPAVPMLSVATGASLDLLFAWIPFTRKWTHQIVVAIIALALAFGGWEYSIEIWKARGPIPVSQAERDNYLTQLFPSYPLYKFMNDTRGTGYRVYAIYDENMAYFSDGVYMGSFFGPVRYARIFGKLSDGQALYGELKSLETDYLLVNSEWGNVNLPQDSFFQNNFRLIYSRGKASLFDLR